MSELNDIFKLDLINFDNEIELNSYIENLDSYLIISKKEMQNYKNQIIFNDLPLNLDKLVERINLNILKNSFSLKSNIKIGKYLLNINSKEIHYENKKAKLTEQEVKILMYLVKSKEAIKIERLEKDIWGYNEELETHTVETHIHRLRKKFINLFDDKNFILSSKNGYLIK